MDQEFVYCYARLPRAPTLIADVCTTRGMIGMILDQEMLAFRGSIYNFKTIYHISPCIKADFHEANCAANSPRKLTKHAQFEQFAFRVSAWTSRNKFYFFAAKSIAWRLKPRRVQEALILKSCNLKSLTSKWNSPFLVRSSNIFLTQALFFDFCFLRCNSIKFKMRILFLIKSSVFTFGVMM